MVDRIAASFEELRLLIPHERYDLVSQLYREGAIITETIEDDGYHLSAKIPDRIIAPYRAFCPDIEEKEPEPWER